MIDPLAAAPYAILPRTQLHETAHRFEAVFLAQMLAAAGAGRAAPEGGIGEAQFTSFLLDAQAERIAQKGGIGLAETIIRHYAPDALKDEE